MFQAYDFPADVPPAITISVPSWALSHTHPGLRERIVLYVTSWTRPTVHIGPSQHNLKPTTIAQLLLWDPNNPPKYRDPRPKPNDLYFYCEDCGILCGLLEAGCEDGAKAWCYTCTKKLWVNDAPEGKEFLAPNVRRYDPISLVARLSTQRMAKAQGVSPSVIRKRILASPPLRTA